MKEKKNYPLNRGNCLLPCKSRIVYIYTKIRNSSLDTNCTNLNCTTSLALALFFTPSPTISPFFCFILLGNSGRITRFRFIATGAITNLVFWWFRCCLDLRCEKIEARLIEARKIDKKLLYSVIPARSLAAFAPESSEASSSSQLWGNSTRDRKRPVDSARYFFFSRLPRAFIFIREAKNNPRESRTGKTRIKIEAEIRRRDSLAGKTLFKRDSERAVLSRVSGCRTCRVRKDTAALTRASSEGELSSVEQPRRALATQPQDSRTRHAPPLRLSHSSSHFFRSLLTPSSFVFPLTNSLLFSHRDPSSSLSLSSLAPLLSSSLERHDASDIATSPETAICLHRYKFYLPPPLSIVSFAIYFLICLIFEPIFVHSSRFCNRELRNLCNFCFFFFERLVTFRFVIVDDEKNDDPLARLLVSLKQRLTCSFSFLFLSQSPPSLALFQFDRTRIWNLARESPTGGFESQLLLSGSRSLDSLGTERITKGLFLYMYRSGCAVSLGEICRFQISTINIR